MIGAEVAPGTVRGAAGRPPLLTREVVWFLVCSVAAFGSFFLLLAVTPLYASGGDESSVAAGLTTGVMMFATVLTELITPGVLTRFGYRLGLGAGIFLLGAPAVLLPLSDGLPLVLGVSLARGAGLAVTVVAGTALAAALSPPGRRGEMLGLYGLAVSVPSVTGLPAGVWLSERLGFTAVFLLAAGVTPVALALVPMLPNPRAEAGTGSHNVLAGLRARGVRRQMAIFVATTIAAGVFVTFVPIAVDGDTAGVAAVALLAHTVAATVARWVAGRVGDRIGAGRLLVPSMAAATLGAACLVAIDSPAAVIGGLALFGAGYGAAQNVSLALMFDLAPENEIGRVSALWNLAFDGGLGIGAVGFGYLTVVSGYPWGFAAVALVLAAATVGAVADRREAAVRGSSPVRAV